MKLTDGTRTIEIELIGINGIDWTTDFYNAGTLERIKDAYKVDDVQDAIEAAVDYCNHRGDYDEITDTETKLYVDGELVAECEEEMTTRAWKVYGADGHRQRESFRRSASFSTVNGRTVEVENSDITGTNEYTIVRITAENAEACHDELIAQVDDGIFENSKVGRCEEING